MENTKCSSHSAKKCNNPIRGNQGEWLKYKQYSHLQTPNDSGYNNWEDVLIASEMTHAQEMKTWAEKLLILDRAYQSKLRKQRGEYDKALEEGLGTVEAKSREI